MRQPRCSGWPTPARSRSPTGASWPATARPDRPAPSGPESNPRIRRSALHRLLVVHLPVVTDRVGGHLRPELLHARVVGLKVDPPVPGKPRDDLPRRVATHSTAAQRPYHEEVGDGGSAVAGRYRHDESAEAPGDLDQP